MSLYDVRDNNVLQPNRYFTLRGMVKRIERDVKWTRVFLSVLNYKDLNGKEDEITVYFTSVTKKVVDNMVMPYFHLLIMGDIVMGGRELYLEGKVVEVYKDLKLVTENNTRVVSADDVNYDKAF